MIEAMWPIIQYHFFLEFQGVTPGPSACIQDHKTLHAYSNLWPENSAANRPTQMILFQIQAHHSD